MEQMSEKERQAVDVLEAMDRDRNVLNLALQDRRTEIGKEVIRRHIKEHDAARAAFAKLIERDRATPYTHEDVMRLVEALEYFRSSSERVDLGGGDAVVATCESLEKANAALAPFTHQAKDGSR